MQEYKFVSFAYGFSIDRRTLFEEVNKISDKRVRRRKKRQLNVTLRQIKAIKSKTYHANMVYYGT